MPDPSESQRGKPHIEDAAVARSPRPANSGIAPALRGGAMSMTAKEVHARAGEAIATLARYDHGAGWPPRVAGAQDVASVAPRQFESPFPPRLQRQYVDAALRHPDVRSLLQGRFELLGCHLVNHKHRPSGRHCVRVCFANYTARHLVDVHLRDLQVESVAERPSHAHPEAPVEMAQAIALARRNPELAAHVAGLHAHAILQVPSPQSPYKDDRCLLVTFTEEDDPHVERQALFVAVVDLNLQQVLKAGRCPCSGDG